MVTLRFCPIPIYEIGIDNMQKLCEQSTKRHLWTRITIQQNKDTGQYIENMLNLVGSLWTNA